MLGDDFSLKRFWRLAGCAEPGGGDGLRGKPSDQLRSGFDGQGGARLAVAMVAEWFRNRQNAAILWPRCCMSFRILMLPLQLQRRDVSDGSLTFWLSVRLRRCGSSVGREPW